jgi:hypothetical protein
VETALWSGDVVRLIGGKIVHLIRKRFSNKLLKLPNVLLMKRQRGSLAQLLCVTSTVDGNKYFPQRCVALCGDNGRSPNKYNFKNSVFFFHMK